MSWHKMQTLAIMEKAENVTNELCDVADMASPSVEEMFWIHLGIQCKV